MPTAMKITVSLITKSTKTKTTKLVDELLPLVSVTAYVLDLAFAIISNSV